MSIYQSLYEKVNKELEELEVLLSELYVKRLAAKSDYNETKEKFCIKKDLLETLEKRKEYMPRKHYFSISLLSGIVGIGTSALLILLFFILLTNIVLSLQIPIQQLSIPIVFSSLISISSSALIGMLLGKKIQNLLEKNSYDKIVNSNEYKDLLKRITNLNDELILIKKDVISKEKTFNKINEEYDVYEKEKDEKKILVEYIAKQIQPTERTLHKSKSFKREHCGDNSCSIL